MTTGRINQVHTIARARRAKPARVQAPMLGRPPGPASRRAPSRFVGGHAASARSRRLRMHGRVSPHLGGARLGPGAELPMRGGPRGRSLASPRPAPPSASARSRRLQTPKHVSPRLGGARLGPGAEVPMRGGPRGRSLASPRLLGCVLKRLKILMKFNSAGPVSKNGPKF